MFIRFRAWSGRLHRRTGPRLHLPSISIDIRTEPLYGETHDVFFNRGVASSQAYARKFGNLSPSNQPSQHKRREALQWLSRDLDEAMLRFIRSARTGDAIRGCFFMSSATGRC